MKALGLSSRPLSSSKGTAGRATWVHQAWQPEPPLRGLNVKQLVTFHIAPSGLVQAGPGALTSLERTMKKRKVPECLELLLWSQGSATWLGERRRERERCFLRIRAFGEDPVSIPVQAHRTDGEIITPRGPGADITAGQKQGLTSCSAHTHKLLGNLLQSLRFRYAQSRLQTAASRHLLPGPHCLCDARNARLPLGGSSDQVRSLCSLLDWLVLVWTLHLLESGLKALG